MTAMVVPKFQEVPGRRQVVDDPVVVVPLVDRLLESFDLVLGVVRLAEHVAVRVVAHEELVRRRIDPVAGEELAEVLRSRLWGRRRRW